MECLPVWNRCNNRCLMCTNPLKYPRIGSYSLRALKARTRKFDRNETDIYLTGGEPTLSPHIIGLLRHLRGRFPKARILMDTNGRMFAYPEFARSCAAVGNIEFQVSICGHNAPSHDAVTRTPGSFAQAAKGLKNLLSLAGRGVTVEARFVLTRLSLPNLGKVYGFARKEFPGLRSLVLIFMEMEGHASLNRKITGLRYREAAGPVTRFFDGLRRQPFEIRLYHFPLCTLPVRLWKYAWRTLPGEEISFPRRCRGCRVKEYCLGVHRGYLAHFGNGEFLPVENSPAITVSGDRCRPILRAG